MGKILLSNANQATNVKAHSLRTVRVVLGKCDRGKSDPPGIRRSAPTVGRLQAARVVLKRIDEGIEHGGNREGLRLRTLKVMLDRCDITPTKSKQTSIGTSHSGVTITIRILQLNMRRSAAVMGEVRQLVSEKKLDILMLQEPYVRKQGTSHTFYGLGTGMKVAAVRSQRPWAMVALSNPRLQIVFIAQLSTTHCSCAEVQAPNFSFYAVSCYFQYSDRIEEHLEHLEVVCRSLKGKRLLVTVDANARSPLWSPRRTDSRGMKFEELIRAHELVVINDVRQGPTYRSNRGTSYIDVTLASPQMRQFVGEWNVRCGWTTSDHLAIDIRIRTPRDPSRVRSSKGNRFDIRRADWDRFSEKLLEASETELGTGELTSPQEVERASVKLQEVIVGTCEEAMPRKRMFRKSNPWWTKELTVRKKQVIRLRRELQEETRTKGAVPGSSLRREYHSSLRLYSKEVRMARISSWQEFVTDQGNKEPWGFVYQQQAEKLKVEKVISTLRTGEHSTKSVEETAKYLLDVHIPDDVVEQDTQEQRDTRIRSFNLPATADAPLFTSGEVAMAIKSFRGNKAPGLDLIETVVLKIANRIIPDQILRLLNGCLQWGVFPKVWKKGSLRVLLKSEDKDERDPKSYRPICLLSVLGKLMEKLIRLRLNDTVLAPGSLSDRQYGFMPGRSTRTQ